MHPAPGVGPAAVAVRMAIITAGLACPASVAAQCVAAQPGGFGLTVQPGSIGFSPPGPSDYEAAWVEFSALHLSVTPNFGGSKDWTLCLRSQDLDMGGYGKPITDLQWHLDGDPTWLPLGTADQPVFLGRKKQDVVLHFRVLLTWAADIPGDYGALLAFTAFRR